MQSFSAAQYLVSESSNFWLRYATTLSFPSNSCMRADPMVWVSAATYNLKGLFNCGGTNTGGSFMYSLISLKAFCCSSPHTNFLSFLTLNSGEKGNTFCDKFDMNLLTQNLHLAPSTQQAGRSWLKSRARSESVRVNFPETDKG
jgi:hypothetical protein